MKIEETNWSRSQSITGSCSAHSLAELSSAQPPQIWHPLPGHTLGAWYVDTVCVCACVCVRVCVCVCRRVTVHLLVQQRSSADSRSRRVPPCQLAHRNLSWPPRSGSHQQPAMAHASPVERNPPYTTDQGCVTAPLSVANDLVLTVLVMSEWLCIHSQVFHGWSRKQGSLETSSLCTLSVVCEWTVHVYAQVN